MEDIPSRNLVNRYIGYCYTDEFFVPEEVHQDIPVRDVLGVPWCSERYTRCMEAMRKAPNERPPIDVVGCRFPKKTLYVVTDGNHRTSVARARDEEKINAIVASVVICSMDGLFVYKDELYKRKEDGFATLLAVGIAKEDAKAIEWMQENLI